ncbi:HAMP domain-containing protein [Thermogemmatispora sp.]|uniref:HAMP domain-containing protein n=1 Tax=Thermogemmatispora sp. TaxID=1968838 RepID=UPI001D9EC869|nr:HAMP domain-containing protein [Thermogemmatispora sp.]MBX5451557.1 HAMP domain-containing protein [Thermogemmatispora sp.]
MQQPGRRRGQTQLPSLATPSLPQEGATAGHSPSLRIRPRSRRSGNLLLNLSIGRRLALGFLLAALIAAVAAGLVGVLRSQSLSRQSSFYQKLLSINTSLTTGADYLQLMNTEVHNLLASASAPAPSQETIAQERQAITGLATRYDSILSAYVAQDLLTNHPDEMELLAEAGQSGQQGQQQTLLASALRTWHLYRAAQDQILQDIAGGNLSEAQNLLRFQAEPTNADALSALRALIQLNQRLAAAVQQAAAVEERNQLITSVIGAIVASLTIALVGWFISGTLVRRLRHLQQVTRSIESGQLEARVTVIGRDEIAEVSAAFNAMLETLLNLLEETRRQRDALTNAAEHLFSDMRVVSAGDLRISAPVSDDPIGLLANAFNFTVGRFRRFVLRVQVAIQQLEVIARQQQEHAEALIQNLHLQQPVGRSENQALSGGISSLAPTDRGRSPSGSLATPVPSGKGLGERLERELTELRGRLRRSREQLQGLREATTVEQLQRLSALLRQIEEEATRPTRWTANAQGVRRELHIPTPLLQQLEHGLSSLQQRLESTLKDVDQELLAIGQEMNRLRVKLSAMTGIAPGGGAGGGENTDTVRLALTFANEVSSLSQQLAAVIQEMRSSLVGFQFETVEAGSASSEPTGRLQAPGGAATSHHSSSADLLSRSLRS